MLLASVLFSLFAYADAPAPSPILDDWKQDAVQSLVVDSKGAVYALGQRRYTENNQIILRKSEDGGTTWNTVFGKEGDPKIYSTYRTELQIDSQDRIYIFYTWYIAEEGASSFTWNLQLSEDGGSSWTSREVFRKKSYDVLAQSTTIDSNNFIYFSGNYNEVGGDFHRVSFKSEDHGLTWVTLEDKLLLEHRNNVSAIASNRNYVGVLQGGLNVDSHLAWSNDGGVTWQETRSFETTERFLFQTHSLWIDPSGHYYVAGSVIVNPNVTGIMIKRTAVAGRPDGEWQTIYQHSEGMDTAVMAAPATFRVDTHGNMWIGMTLYQLTEFGLKSFSIVKQGDSNDFSAPWRNVDSYDHFPNAEQDALALTGCIKFILGLNNELFVASSRHESFQNGLIPMSLVRKVPISQLR